MMLKAKLPFRRNIARLAGDCAGATIVEFALIAMPLMLILIGGFDLAHQSYVRSVMQGALTDAARQAAVENPALSGTSGTVEERVANLVKGQILPIAPGATITVTQSNYYDFAGIGNPEKLVKDEDGDGVYDETDGDCFSDLDEDGVHDQDTGRTGIGGANDVVQYQATLTMDRLVPLHHFVGGSEKYHLKADTAIRNQPWDTQKTPPTVCGTKTP
ncbi:TadE/TadG family type IV pilus assembly protein [Paraurantiacibacter namhicola]|uniref:TadE-like protein n=1 Tax=Paraurantiacibacter namhicola TaxID=645517 RepID=A0A1C7D6J5_9SPHN|nr:TadE/TadG family type IV pilus assembly protein [Paraurantiacibacter namhicola]ANU07080.1 TadE-like protein [Paraurantiacibacter namhicola]